LEIIKSEITLRNRETEEKDRGAVHSNLRADRRDRAQSSILFPLL
jgi:hypothetical protein